MDILSGVLCTLLAVVWLSFCYGVTYIAYHQGIEIEDCPLRADATAIRVDGDWPSLKHTCVYRQADGSLVEKSRYVPQGITAVVGATVGIVGAGLLLWFGFRRRKSP